MSVFCFFHNQEINWALSPQYLNHLRNEALIKWGFSVLLMTTLIKTILFQVTETQNVL